jgi:curved DNA-binding protein
MEFKDYYSVMGLERSATPEDIKRAHRKLARKYHPDVSKEANAEAHFKKLAEAYDVLKDPERRAAYDQLGASHRAGQDFRPPPGWNAQQRPAGAASADSAFFDQGDDHSEFFDSLFKGMGRGAGGASAPGARRRFDMHGQDQHAKIQISIEDSYNGAKQALQLRVPQETADGSTQMHDRHIEFTIPKGIRAGQHIRLAAQGGLGMGQGGPGDLYLDVEFLPHPLYRVDHNDVYMDLPIAPWEAALGAEVEAPTPTGRVEIKIPADSAAGRKLRVKGRGLPATAGGKAAGDFYFVLHPTQPTADTEATKTAWAALAAAFPGFRPRAHIDAIEKTL